MSSEDDQIVQEFLVESQENLDQLDRDLVELEQHPGSRELVSAIFRTIHTIKGTSGFVAFGRLESLTHVGENLLSRLRDGELTMTPPIAGALLRMVDCVRGLLAAIENTGTDTDPAIDVDGTVEALLSCVDASTAPRAPEPVTDTPPPAEEWDGVERRRGGTVRVDVDLLETLVRLVGELVLTRNQILQQADAAADVDLAAAAQRLNLVASELQQSVMKMRMQPIGQIWAKLPRIVRDLAAQLGRRVRLEMDGQETELDRSLLEAVKDPLTHLVRNAIDHGLEPPEERAARGKPAEGLLSLRAYHQSGQVVVEVTDDGRGLDAARIGAVAVQHGIFGADQLARMDEREVRKLIFRPGFSTAGQVTNVSGRGVGMDVVRTNIERIGGTVDLAGRPGQGTTVRVRIPLAVAIIPALVVGQGGQRYAIPQANLVELLRLDLAEQARDIEVLGSAPVVRLRGQLLPLVGLAGTLGIDEQPTDALTVVVVQADDIRFGLAVAEVHDTQEIVVKPLDGPVAGTPAYAGATTLGDGQVALILDVGGLAQSAGVTAASKQMGAGLTRPGAEETLNAATGPAGTATQLKRLLAPFRS